MLLCHLTQRFFFLFVLYYQINSSVGKGQISPAVFGERENKGAQYMRILEPLYHPHPSSPSPSLKGTEEIHHSKAVVNPQAT